MTTTQAHTPHLSMYTVDRFRSGPVDRDGFLTLYESVFDRERTAEWFRWKYEENPYTDHVPITVARDRSQRTEPIVGCRSYFPLPVTVDGEDAIAFQPCDTMVHPDHRRRGLFTAMNRWGLEHYRDRDRGPAFFFNFPNANSRRGNEKLGWQPVGTVPMYYRPQNPIEVLARWVHTAGPVDPRGSTPKRSAVTSESTSTRLSAAAERFTLVGDALERTATRVVTASHDRCDRLVTTTTDPSIVVDRYELPPVRTLATLADRTPTAPIEVRRTARFYRWRLDNPAQEYVTFVAREEATGDPIAAAVVSPLEDRVRVIETLPRRGAGAEADDAPNDERTRERAALESLLVGAFDRYQDRPFFTAFGNVLPNPRSLRFVPDTEPPLNALLQPTARTLYARATGDADRYDVESRSIDDWQLSRLDLDTA